jgi:hypothetical protein
VLGTFVDAGIYAYFFTPKLAPVEGREGDCRARRTRRRSARAGEGTELLVASPRPAVETLTGEVHIVHVAHPLLIPSRPPLRS